MSKDSQFTYVSRDCLTKAGALRMNHLHEEKHDDLRIRACTKTNDSSIIEKAR
jgi:hypothetical protein